MLRRLESNGVAVGTIHAFDAETAFPWHRIDVISLSCADSDSQHNVALCQKGIDVAERGLRTGSEPSMER
jgi:hypothetical protein